MELSNTPPTGPVKFTTEEAAELLSIRESYERLTAALGQLEMERRNLAKNQKAIDERLLATESQEKVFLDKIVAKYGEGTFDPASGIFTPKKA